MTGPRFCALAPLLAAYPGALAARIGAEQRKTEPAAAPAHRASAGPSPAQFSRATSGGI